MKSVQIRSFFWSAFSYIPSEYRKIRTRKNSVFEHFSRSDTPANKSVYEARTLGVEQYSSYKEGVFVLRSKSIYETIKRNKLSLYKNTNTVVISKTQKNVASLKQDYQLYSNFYVACQNREGDLEEFFAYENHAYPRSLSIYGKMRSTDKSDTINIFKNIVETSIVKPDFTAGILDGAAVVQAVVPKGSTNFEQHCKNEFTVYLFKKYRQSTLNRSDIVFHIYLDHSIKNSTRNNRGFGKRIKIAYSKTLDIFSPCQRK